MKHNLLAIGWLGLMVSLKKIIVYDLSDFFLFSLYDDLKVIWNCPSSLMTSFS